MEDIKNLLATNLVHKFPRFTEPSCIPDMYVEKGSEYDRDPKNFTMVKDTNDITKVDEYVFIRVDKQCFVYKFRKNIYDISHMFNLVLNKIKERAYEDTNKIKDIYKYEGYIDLKDNYMDVIRKLGLFAIQIEE